MRRRALIVVLLVLLWTCLATAAPDLKTGIHLMAQDETYLGKCTANKCDSDSFLNPYGS